MTTPFPNYTKHHLNQDIIQSFETHIDSSQLTNYIPMYQSFFECNEKNANHIQLQTNHLVQELLQKKETNVYSCKLTNEHITDVFIKQAPLIEPSKYLNGAFHDSSNQMIQLPTFSFNSSCETLTNELNKVSPLELMNCFNNSAYVDSLFNFFTDHLYHSYGFTHGIQYYGQFNSIIKNFNYDVMDDIEYLEHSDYFSKNKDNIYSISEEYLSHLSDTRSFKKKIEISSENIDIEIENTNDEIIQDTQPNDSSDLEEVNDMNVDDSTRISKHSSSSSSCSSRTSLTRESDAEECSDTESESSSNEDESNSQSSSKKSIDEQIMIQIFDYPVHLICMEKCENTFDYLMEHNDLSNDEWKSAFFQIIMILVTYQKVFSFTHNDLHTNNIMYCSTEKPFLYYKYNDKHYKIPTFGRIFKIIDFGRAIFHFHGKVYMGDCYRNNEVASNQYNYSYYHQENKTEIKPNPSFDLCRLATSLYDFFIDDVSEEKNCKCPIAKLIIEWCYDDDNKNVLYKSSGLERYPDFKLYKMIARKVHKHTPQNQLEQPIFLSYQVPKKKIQKTAKIINIDEMPILS